jgi:N-acetylglutamate synthase-like GNAT family acetyltransferase
LHNAALAGTGPHLGNGPWDDDLHHIERVYLDAGGEFLVGDIDDHVVAMGALQRKDEAVAALRRMRVDPSCQRRGYGHQVLEALESRATELGYVRMVLDTTTAQIAIMHSEVSP